MLITNNKWGSKMKYSFIVPIYNGEKYIDRCLNSILKQDYDNYEIIIVNDGSTDYSLEILNKYREKYKQIKLYTTENSGISITRNYGITKATGEYFIFVDIDDYIKDNMLSYINECLINCNDGIELIKYNYLMVDEHENIIGNIDKNEVDFEVLSGDAVFRKLVANKVPFDLTCIYAYKTSFWRANNFQFESNRYHEDFGLIPFIIIRCKKVLQIDKVLYYYVQSKNSITRHINIQKQIKQMEDILYHFDNLYKRVNDDNLLSNCNLKIFNSYIANGVLNKYKKLDKNNQRLFRQELVKRKVVNLLLDDTILRRLKKQIYKYMI